MITFITDLLERPLKDGFILHNRYKIVQFIGKGSYGLAYRATDLLSDYMVVVKQLRKRKSKAGIGFLAREAKMLSSLNHPSIPKMVDLFEADEKSFLVMEFVDGKNMEELIFKEGRIYNEKESFYVFLKVLKVVQYFHEKCIIHRDLRLPNILFDNEKVYIIDFGLAVSCDDKETIPFEKMPLEKRLFREIAFTSDFYALGHFILFLLYSNYQSSTWKEESWEKELGLGNETKVIIRKLLKLDPCYGNVMEIITDVEKVLLMLKD